MQQTHTPFWSFWKMTSVILQQQINAPEVIWLLEKDNSQFSETYLPMCSFRSVILYILVFPLFHCLSGWSFVYTIQRLWFTSWWYSYSNWFLIYLIISGLTTRRLLQVKKYILGKGSRLHKKSQNWLPLRKTTKNYIQKENQTSRLCNTVQTGYYKFQYTR